MKIFNKQAAQGDILITKISKLPNNLEKQKPNDDKYIVAHSETGHHHTMKSSCVNFYKSANDDMIMYLEVNNPTPLIHNRSFDTHEPIMFDKGIYEIRRQREYIPTGWRRIED